jgi:hypothetical protein
MIRRYNKPIRRYIPGSLTCYSFCSIYLTKPLKMNMLFLR